MNHPLDGCAAKIDRSREHLEAIDRRAQRFYEEDPDGIYRLHGKANAKRTKCLFRIEFTREFPFAEFGIMFGDAVHCLRSALDQLVFTISDDPDSMASSFPVARTRRDWVVKAPANVWGVSDSLIALIDQAQPYHRGNHADSHPLAILNTLSNLDKHRFIPVTALVPDSAEARVTGTQGIKSHGEFILKTGRPAINGAVVGEISIVPDKSGLEPQVQMEGNLSFVIGFGKPGMPTSIVGKPIHKVAKSLGQFTLETLNTIALQWTDELNVAAGASS